MQHILLTGAGFSRNWGGWLADEAFEYLLGCPKVSKEVLWRYKQAGGFEAAYDELQTEAARQGRSVALLNEATDFNAAIRGMFADMNKAFVSIPFEFQNESEYLIRSYLVRFDAIFTLNQDLLMEQRYLDDNVTKYSYRRWNGWQIPGMQRFSGQNSLRPIDMQWSPMNSSEFAVEKGLQPYFKLHGSSNWFENINGHPMLVIGANKVYAIARRAILWWNYERFRDYLSKPETRLMVIGYSFRDEHINVAIRDAAEKGELKLFIIDPLGVDVLTNNRLTLPGSMFEKLQPHLIGASRRPLSQIFGGDRVEHGKVMRFFSSP